MCEMWVILSAGNIIMLVLLVFWGLKISVKKNRRLYYCVSFINFIGMGAERRDSQEFLIDLIIYNFF